MKSINCVLFVGIVSVSSAYAMRDISSSELVKELRLGWNLGNSLDALCTDWLDYNNDQTASETCWGNVKTTQDLFTTLMNEGINTFRIPITWTGHIGNTPNYTIDKNWLKRVHEVVNYSYQNDAYVIINSYNESWINAYNDNKEYAKEVKTNLWKPSAEEFKDYDEHLIFECMNSPRKVGSNAKYSFGDDESWKFINEVNKAFIDTVRKAKGNNPKRHLLISPYGSLIGQDTMKKLEIPTYDKKIMVSLHGNINSFSKTTDIEWTMNNINQQFLTKNIPVIITELRTANRADNSESISLAKYYIKKATDAGIPCMLWDNGKLEYGNEYYGLINRITYEIIYPDYLNAVLEASYSNIDKPEEENHSRQKNNFESILKQQNEQFKYIPVFSKRNLNKMIALNGSKNEVY